MIVVSTLFRETEIPRRGLAALRAKIAIDVVQLQFLG